MSSREFDAEDPDVSGYSADFADEVGDMEAPPLPLVPSVTDLDAREDAEGDYANEEEFADELNLTHESLLSPKKGDRGDQVKSNSLHIATFDKTPFADTTLGFGYTNQFHFHLKTREGMSSYVNTTMPISVTTQCDILCTTNTVLNYVIEKVAFPLQDTMGHLPYKGRRMNRVTHWKKGETPWQKFKMTEAKVERNSILKDERDEFMIRLKYEQEEREMMRNFLATRIQALYRGILSRRRLDKRRMRPGLYARTKKGKYRVVQADIQDELCTLASILNLQPIPGLCLISRGKASRRMRKIQLAAALRMQKFFKMITARAVCRRRLDHLRYVRIHKAARIVTRFFKSLRMRTFAHRCRVEKFDRAVRIMQRAVRVCTANHRVRVLRRNIIYFRRMNAASILLTRSFRRKFLIRGAFMLTAVHKTVNTLLEETVVDHINAGISEREAHLREEFVIDAATETLAQELLVEAVTIEEECRIAVRLQKLAEEMREREQERKRIEEELRRNEEKAEREAQAKAEKEALAKAEREALAKAEKEALAKAEREAQAKAEHKSRKNVAETIIHSAIQDSIRDLSVKVSRKALSDISNAPAKAASLEKQPSPAPAQMNMLETDNTSTSAKSRVLARIASSGEFPSGMFTANASRSLYSYMLTACQFAAKLIDEFSFTQAKRILDCLGDCVSKDNSPDSAFISSQIAMHKAIIQRKQHDYAGAIEEYQIALTLYAGVIPRGHPLETSAASGIAACISRQGRYRAALAAFKLAISSQSDKVDPILPLDADIRAFIVRKCSSASRALTSAQTEIDVARLHFLRGHYKLCKDSMLVATSLLSSEEAFAIEAADSDELYTRSLISARLMSLQVDWESQLLPAQTTQQSNILETLLNDKRDRYEPAISAGNEEQDTHLALMSSLLRVIKQQLKHSEFADIDHFLHLISLPLSENTRNEPDDETKATILHVTALTQRARGEFSEATQNAESALRIFRSARPGDGKHCLVAESVLLLGNLKLDILALKEAANLLEESFNMQKECFEYDDGEAPYHLTTLETMYSQGRLYALSGQQHLAFEILNQVIDHATAVMRDNGIQGHHLVEMCNLEISELLLQLGQYTECKAVISEAGKSIMALSGNKHASVSDGLFLLSRIVMQEGKHSDADALLSRTLDMRIEIFGDQHPRVGDIYSALASNHRMWGYFEEAAHSEALGLSISSKTYPKDSARWAVAVAERALLLRDCGQLAPATELFNEAMSILSVTLGKDSVQYITLLGELGELQRMNKEWPESLATLQTAIEGAQKLFGKESILNANLMRYYAHTLLCSGTQEKTAQANSILKDSVMAIQSRILPQTHPSVLYTKGLMGLGLTRLETPRTGRADDSDPSPSHDLIDDAIDFFDKHMNLSEIHPWVVSLGGYLTKGENEHDKASSVASSAGSARSARSAPRSARSDGGLGSVGEVQLKQTLDGGDMVTIDAAQSLLGL